MPNTEHLTIRWEGGEPIPLRAAQRSRPEHLEVALWREHLRVPVDFASNCIVTDTRTDQALFSGAVERQQNTNESVVIALVDGSQELKEGVLRGFVTKPSSSNLRLMHALLRLFDTPDSQIDLEGYTAPSASSRYRMVVPLVGELFNPPVQLGHVLLTSDPEVHAELDLMPFEEKGHSSYLDAFRAAKSWAVADVTAQLLCDAEQEDLNAIGDAIAAYVASRRYSLSHLPNGTIRPGFQRVGSTLCNIRPEPLAYTCSDDLGDGWFRSLDATQNSFQGGAFQANVLAQEALDVFTPEERAALNAWHDAVNLLGRRELVRCLDALWRGFEYYSHGVSVPSLFSSDEIARLIDTRPAWLTDEQWGKYQRTVKEVLPSPPLLVRVWEAASRDKAPLLPGDVEAVSRARKVRNTLSHGRRATVDDARTVATSARVLNRLLVYRAHAKAIATAG